MKLEYTRHPSKPYSYKCQAATHALYALRSIAVHLQVHSTVLQFMTADKTAVCKYHTWIQGLLKWAHLATNTTQHWAPTSCIILPVVCHTETIHDYNTWPCDVMIELICLLFANGYFLFCVFFISWLMGILRQSCQPVMRGCICFESGNRFHAMLVTCCSTYYTTSNHNCE